MQAFNPIWFTYCSVHHSCTWRKVFFSNTSPATLMRGKNVEARQRCSHNCAQAQRLAITLTWIDFLCAWMAQWEVKKKKKVFPLHGFILIFIVPLHTESTNVRENGLDICSNSLLFLSLHPSFSLSLFPFLCSHSPDTWCLPLPDRGGDEEEEAAMNGWWKEWEHYAVTHLGF